MINSSKLVFYASRAHLTNRKIMIEGGVIQAHSLGLTLNRTVGEGIHEEIEIVNYSGKQVTFVLELAIRSDYADLFEVKNNNIVQRGKQRTHWDGSKKLLRTSYDHKDFHRAADYQITNTNSPVGYANGRIFFEIELEQDQHWQMCADLILEHVQHIQKPSPGSCSFGQMGTASTGATPSPEQEPKSNFDQRQARWQARCTNIATPNNDLYRNYRQAVDDMGALRIYDMDVPDEA